VIDSLIAGLESQFQALVAVQMDCLLAAVAHDVLQFLLRLRGQGHGAGLLE
jgi:hypothetical protein